MTRSFTSVVSSKPLRFLVTGSITAWDPVGRRLRIEGRRLWVAPKVAVFGVADGVAGHGQRAPGRPGRPMDRDPLRVQLTASRPGIRWSHSSTTELA